MEESVMTVLVVDDDEFTAEMTGMIIESGGYGVEIALSGPEALEKLDANPGILAVVSDHNMPLVTGEELFCQLRERGCDLPFVLLTGSDADGLRARNPSMDGVVAKDENLADELALIIGRLLAG